jgi:glyoxylase-like metal-dependent hydrolase (beta-lactamase superfamily II)
MTAYVCSFFHAPTGTWSHLVSDPVSRSAMIIDPVLDFDMESGRVGTDHAELLLTHARGHNLRVEWILESHAHADHLTAADWLKRTLRASGISPKTGIGAGIVAVQKHFGEIFDFGPKFKTDGSQFDRLFNDGDSFALGTLTVRVIATPGHTNDGMSYLIDDALFVGDTLFAPERGTARCDFPGADAYIQYRSIQRLYALPDATRVFLCHDYPQGNEQPCAQSTIGEEKTSNIQLTSITTEASYVAMRTSRDATLATPQLLYQSLQVNICAGQLPETNIKDGVHSFALPREIG